MLYSVSGDLRPVRKWISTHKASVVDRHSEDEWEVKILDEDEEDFVDMCDNSDVECEFLSDCRGTFDC